MAQTKRMRPETSFPSAGANSIPEFSAERDTVCPANCLEHDCAVFHRSAHRPDLIHAPTQRHRTVAAHAPKGGAQTGDTAAIRRRYDRAECLCPDGKAHQPGGCGRARSSRRTRRAFFPIPRILRHPPIDPYIVHGERAHAELGDQYRAGFLQPIDHGGVDGGYLIPIGFRAPRGANAARGEQVFRAVRNAVQQAAIIAPGYLAIGAARLLESKISCECDDALQDRIVARKPIEIQLRQFDGRDLFRADQRRELPHRPEGNVFVVVR